MRCTDERRELMQRGGRAGALLAALMAALLVQCPSVHRRSIVWHGN